MLPALYIVKPFVTMCEHYQIKPHILMELKSQDVMNSVIQSCNQENWIGKLNGKCNKMLLHLQQKIICQG